MPSQFHWLMFVVCTASSALLARRGGLWGLFAGLAFVHLTVWAACLFKAWELRTLMQRGGEGP